VVDSPDSVTRLLADMAVGNRSAAGELVQLLNRELHVITERSLAVDRPNCALQPTALVNEAFLKLVDQRSVTWRSRAQFFGVAASLMRRILVDYAHTQSGQTFGNCRTIAAAGEARLPARDRDVDLIALDEALQNLSARDSEAARVVEFKFFAGLTTLEIAEVLGVSTSTVEREWTAARAWLYRAMRKGSRA
jgi:RNA polymerase sigma factor (TIGR02999 family)